MEFEETISKRSTQQHKQISNDDKINIEYATVSVASEEAMILVLPAVDLCCPPMLLAVDLCCLSVLLAVDLCCLSVLLVAVPGIVGFLLVVARGLLLPELVVVVEVVLLSDVSQGLYLGILPAQLVKVAFLRHPMVEVFFHSVSEEHIKSVTDNEVCILINLGTCELHVVHGSLRTGVEPVNWDIHCLLCHTCYLFTDSTARQALFTQLTGCTTFPLKFCGVRWLENATGFQRALQIWDHVKFHKEEKLPKTKPVGILKRAACDPFLKIKFSRKKKTDKIIGRMLPEIMEAAAMKDPASVALDNLNRSSNMDHLDVVPPCPTRPQSSSRVYLSPEDMRNIPKKKDKTTKKTLKNKNGGERAMLKYPSPPQLTSRPLFRAPLKGTIWTLELRFFATLITRVLTIQHFALSSLALARAMYSVMLHIVLPIALVALYLSMQWHSKRVRGSRLEYHQPSVKGHHRGGVLDSVDTGIEVLCHIRNNSSLALESDGVVDGGKSVVSLVDGFYKLMRSLTELGAVCVKANFNLCPKPAVAYTHKRKTATFERGSYVLEESVRKRKIKSFKKELLRLIKRKLPAGGLVVLTTWHSISTDVGTIIANIRGYSVVLHGRKTEFPGIKRQPPKLVLDELDVLAHVAPNRAE
uniref:Uncharacterized protein n=1 Tax=Timema bartmani TaxID=61472 RepID=A0A7R9ERC4_9NEOP|nr:unnamed protein product [Timema bartmani]